MIGAVHVDFVFQLSVEQKEIVHEIELEYLNIFFLPLLFHKASPCQKQILDRVNP